MSTQQASMQTFESKRKPMGKARMKPRHLSPVIWQLIIDQFRVRKSSEDVAEELGLPSRTVSDVIDLYQMGVGPEAARPQPFLMRRAG